MATAEIRNARMKELVTLVLTKYTNLTEEEAGQFYETGLWGFSGKRTLSGKNPIIVEMKYGERSIWLEDDRTLDKYATWIFE